MSTMKAPISIKAKPIWFTLTYAKVNFRQADVLEQCMAKAKEIVLQFVEQINSQNVDGLCSLMSEQHRFIDAFGAIVQGREQMRQAW
ncbi:MAG TPA: nuclear transport factor 2 family protein [Pyrinomonadaceae bacterium]|nr:nuclear transport factor 2 family protein [Pyrinomonadaceae bacterium]